MAYSHSTSLPAPSVTAEAADIPAAATPVILVPPDVPPGASLGVSTSEADRDAARPEEEWLDAGQAIGQHLAVPADASASEDARAGSQDALLTALSGGYEPEVRLPIARWLLEAVDVAYHSLLARHLEAIRDEARVVGKEQVAKEASGLLKRLPTAEAVREASLSVLHRRRAAGLGTHSFFWAGFVAAGDWRWGLRMRDMAESLCGSCAPAVNLYRRGLRWPRPEDDTLWTADAIPVDIPPCGSAAALRPRVTLSRRGSEGAGRRSLIHEHFVTLAVDPTNHE